MKLVSKILVIVFFVFSMLEASVVGKVLKIKGQVFADNKVLKVGDVVSESQTITTKKHGWVMIEQPSGNIIKIAKNSNIKFNKVNIVTQSSGKVFVKVSKRGFAKAIAKGLPRFTVKTKTATMGIRGTNFVIDLTGKKEQVKLRNGDLTVNANKGTFNYYKSEMLAEMQAMRDEWKKYKEQQAAEWKAYKASFSGYKPQPPTKKVKMKPRRVITIDPATNNLFEDNFAQDDDKEFSEFDSFGGFSDTKHSNSAAAHKHSKQKHQTEDSFNSDNDPDFKDSKIDKELDSF